MTVRDFCNKYNCKFQSVYEKIKRSPEKYAGHIFISDTGRITDIDETAEDMLIPKDKRIELLLLEISRLSNKNVSLQRKCDELQSENQNISHKVSSLSNEITSLTEKCRQLESTELGNHRLSEELSDTKCKLEECDFENKGLLQRCSELSEQIIKKSDEINLLNKQVTDMKSVLFDKCAEVQMITAEKSALLSENEHLKNKNERLFALAEKKKGFFG